MKEKENQLQLYLDEFSEIRKNIVLLKPLFKRFIIIRGKADNFTEKKQFEKFIKISEDEYSCNIILPSVLQKENDNGLIDKKGENIFCSSNRIFLNHKVFFDDIFTVFDENLIPLQKIFKNNNQDAYLNKHISNILSAFFNKYSSFNEKDKKDYFSLHISDPIKVEKSNSELLININFFICLEDQIKEYLNISNLDVNCYVITNNDFVLYSSYKNIGLKDVKKNILNIFKIDLNKSKYNTEKNIVDYYFKLKDQAKKVLIDENEIRLQKLNINNYELLDNFRSLLEKYHNSINGIFINVTILKNKSEMKFLYFDINKPNIYNEIIKQLIDIPNKQFKQKIIKKYEELSNEENKILNLITENINFNQVKYSSCFLDLLYDFDLEVSEKYLDLEDNTINISKKNNIEDKQNINLGVNRNDTRRNSKFNNNSNNLVEIRKDSENMNKNTSFSRTNSINKGNTANNKSLIINNNDFKGHISNTKDKENNEDLTKEELNYERSNSRISRKNSANTKNLSHHKIKKSQDKISSSIYTKISNNNKNDNEQLKDINSVNENKLKFNKRTCNYNNIKIMNMNYLQSCLEKELNIKDQININTNTDNLQQINHLRDNCISNKGKSTELFLFENNSFEKSNNNNKPQIVMDNPIKNFALTEKIYNEYKFNFEINKLIEIIKFFKEKFSLN